MTRRDAYRFTPWWRFQIVFPFLFKVVEDNLPLVGGFLDVSCVSNLLLQYLSQDVSWEQLSLTETQV